MSSGSQDSSAFEERKKKYFADLLRRKWECEASGHGVCVRTADGGHHQVSQEDVEKWVEALCIGEATTSQPPYGVLDSKRESKSAASSLTVVSLPPSRLRNVGSPTLAASASFNASRSSWASSGVPGPGYYSGKAIKWLGGRSLDAIEVVIVLRKVQKYRDQLRGWEKADESRGIALERQKEVYQILEDVLEMSRPCYSIRVNRAAGYIGQAVDAWCSAIPPTDDMAFFLSQTHICLSLLDLAPWARFDSATEDLCSDLRDALIRVPLALHDVETTSAAIKILALDLMYSSRPSHTRYRWLGQNFTRIVARTLQLRSLTESEMGAIRGIAQRCHDESPMACRPWEIVLLAHCSARDESFREIVLGKNGIPRLFWALEGLLSKPILNARNDWIHLEDVLWGLREVSWHSWAVHDMERGSLRLLLRALRMSPPDARFRIRFWTVFTLRNMVHHSPSLLHTLDQDVATPAIEYARHALASLPHDATRTDERLQNDAIKSLEYLSEEMGKWPGNLIFQNM